MAQRAARELAHVRPSPPALRVFDAGMGDGTVLRTLKSALKHEARNYNFNAYSDSKAIFRYRMHTLPDEISDSIGTSTLLAAWNAAIYVGQIEDQKLERVLDSKEYIEATARVLQRHNGLWFNGESFVISCRGH